VLLFTLASKKHSKKRFISTKIGQSDNCQRRRGNVSVINYTQFG